MRIAPPAGDGRARVEPRTLQREEELARVCGLGGNRVEEVDRPGVPRRWRISRERGGTGQWDGCAEEVVAQPEADQRGADRRAGAVGGQPRVHPLCCGKERRAPVADKAGEVPRGALHLTFLIEIRRDDPLVQGQGVSGVGQDLAAVDHARRLRHTQPQALEHGGELPGVD
jgi:hypothetical protein